MIKARMTWTDADGQQEGVTSLLDWLAWEKHTGKSAGKLAENFTHLEDVLFLAYQIAKRNGEKRPFEGWVARLEDEPTAEIIDTKGPTKPGA